MAKKKTKKMEKVEAPEVELTQDADSGDANVATSADGQDAQVGSPQEEGEAIQEETEGADDEIGSSDEADEGGLADDELSQADNAEFMAKLMDYGNEVNLQPKDGEAADTFQARVIEKIAEIPDDEWKALKKETQLWFNDVVRAMREEKAASAKPTKNKKKKEKVEKAKGEAKKISAEKVGTGFKKHSNGWEILKLVQDNAGEKGLTMDEIVKLAEAKPVKSGSIPNRVRQVVMMGALKDDQYGGFLDKVGDKFIYVGRDLDADPDPAAPKPKEAKTKKGGPTDKKVIVPTARKRAKEVGLDPETVEGTGKNGAVTLPDVEARIAADSGNSEDPPKKTKKTKK